MQVVDQNLKIAAYHKKVLKIEAFWRQTPSGLCVLCVAKIASFLHGRYLVIFA